ncbi:MAG TPA: hypothetical protein ENH28_00125 [Euryarchaeota archaeon]|nr:hypothetical protein [Euryarchaeota archaeon]
MSEYVKWCSSVEDLALGNCVKVRLRTLRYSIKNLSRVFCFFAVRGRQLSNTVFFNVSPVYRLFLKYLKHLQFLPPLKGVGLLGDD